MKPERLLRLLFLCLSLFAGAALAQAWPAKPIRFILPVPPGGGTDILTRNIQAKLGEALGQTILVENRPGGGATIGTDLVAKAAPDGYTFLMIDTALTVNPSLYSKLPFDTLRDLAPVSLAATAPVILVTHPSLAVKNLEELLALARANPGKYAYASGGNGTAPHLSGEVLKQVAKIDLIHVPYKGIGPAIADVLGGQVAMIFTGISSAKQQVAAGKLRAIAHTGEKRSPAMPEVPTFVELGWGAVEARSYWGALAPAATPREIVVRMSAAMDKVLNQPEIRQKLEDLGFTVIGGPPERHAANVRSEIDRWAKVVKTAGIKAD